MTNNFRNIQKIFNGPIYFWLACKYILLDSPTPEGMAGYAGQLRPSTEGFFALREVKTFFFVQLLAFLCIFFLFSVVTPPFWTPPLKKYIWTPSPKKMWDPLKKNFKPPNNFFLLDPPQKKLEPPKK